MKASQAVIHREKRKRQAIWPIATYELCQITYDMFLEQQNLPWNYCKLHMNLKSHYKTILNLEMIWENAPSLYFRIKQDNYSSEHEVQKCGW